MAIFLRRYIEKLKILKLYSTAAYPLFSLNKDKDKVMADFYVAYNNCHADGIDCFLLEYVTDKKGSCTFTINISDVEKITMRKINTTDPNFIGKNIITFYYKENNCKDASTAICFLNNEIAEKEFKFVTSLQKKYPTYIPMNDVPMPEY